MNGFTNAILSLLLGWIRALIFQLWKLLSGGGSGFFAFLSEHWKIIVIILCVGGFIADRIIYLFRWRPYYIWRSKQQRKRREREQARAAKAQKKWYARNDEPPFAADASTQRREASTSVASPQPRQTIAPELYNQPYAAYQRPASDVPFGAQFESSSNEGEMTAHYAPAGRAGTAQQTFYTQPYRPPSELSPVFDDDMGGWNQSDTLVKPVNMSIRELAGNMESSFGVARPEPIDYMRDIQAGFARPLPPEQLYQPSPGPAAVSEEPSAVAGPNALVHPGLDMANFRRNIGLSPAGPLASNDQEAEPPAFTATRNIFSDGAQAQSTRSHNPLSSLAKKARGFVGVNAEDDPRSIRDLHPSVDLRNAFHEPVYPKPKSGKEDDDL